MKTTIALVTIAVLGFGVVAHGQNANSVLAINFREATADGNSIQGRGFTMRIGDVATLSADRFEFEQPAVIRLFDNVHLGVGTATSTGSFSIKGSSSGGITLQLPGVVITADGAEPDYQSGVLRLLGDVRIREERAANK